MENLKLKLKKIAAFAGAAALAASFVTPALAAGLQDLPTPIVQGGELRAVGVVGEKAMTIDVAGAMEAMAAGLPVITTKVGYLKEYIKPNKNGMFFASRNSVSLRTKIEKLLNNPKLRNELGTAARKKIVSQYSWEKTVEQIEKALSIF